MDAPEGMAFIISMIVAAVIAAAFVASSFLSIRERHRDTAAWRIHLGSAIYGLVFGGVLGFVLVPLRMELVSGDMPSELVGPAAVTVLILVIAVRRGWLAKISGIGPYMRAYRRAALRRTIEVSEKQLAKLTPQATLEGAV